MLRGYARNFSRAAGFRTTMLSMRVCAGLALSAVLCSAAAAPRARAATYCAGSVPAYYGCSESTSGIQEALDAAGANPGHDLVYIAGGEHTLSTGLVYSDHGQVFDSVTVAAGGECTRYSCTPTTLAGGLPGVTLLGFTGGGGAKVRVYDLGFEPAQGATALMLPPDGEALVRVHGADGSTGIRAEGTDAHPAVIQGGSFLQPIGGAQDVAIDAVGAARIEYGFITSDIAARSRGTEGALEIRNATISAITGATGRNIRVTRTLLDLRNRPAPVVGLEAVCAGPGAPDADVSATNVTVLASGAAGDTGARAVGRGGDGDSCDALVRLNSTILNGVGRSLDASGEQGAGTDPRDGAARFDIRYSNFDPAAIHQGGPSEIETAAPGGNVFGDPRFNPRAEAELGWDSPLIDRGDPAGLAEWEEPYFRTVNGRRDIGLREYQFATPTVNAVAEPDYLVRPGRPVRLGAGAGDVDRDPLQVRWTFSNGDVREYEDVGQVPIPYFTRRYPRVGTYVEKVTVTDPTGRSASNQISIKVRRQRMLRLAVRHPRLRPPGLASVPAETTIEFKTRMPDLVRFRIERGIARRRAHGLRWVRTRHRFAERSNFGVTTRGFNGWVEGKLLRPGRYRLVAAPRGVRPLRARFRVLRVAL
jgi:hypothetical protein